MKLYGLPFAGGGAHAYRGIDRALGEGLELVGVELPGRGRRMGEAPLSDLGAMARDVVGRLRGELEAPYGLLGHSMGATLGFLVARRLVAEGYPPPKALIVSGQRPPYRPREKPPRYLLPEARFRDELRSLGGCPPEVLENEELMELFLPVLRADFQAVETFEPLGAPEVLALPLLALAGEQDEDAAPEAVAEWEAMTSSGFELRAFPGGHFFLLERAEEVAAAVEGFLRRRPPAG